GRIMGQLWQVSGNCLALFQFKMSHYPLAPSLACLRISLHRTLPLRRRAPKGHSMCTRVPSRFPSKPGRSSHRPWKGGDMGVKLETGGVGKWLNPAVLKLAGRAWPLMLSMVYKAYE